MIHMYKEIIQYGHKTDAMTVMKPKIGKQIIAKHHEIPLSAEFVEWCGQMGAVLTVIQIGRSSMSLNAQMEIRLIIVRDKGEYGMIGN
jgi:hypothetical protein